MSERSAVCVMEGQRPAGVHTGRPNQARVCDYLLGGKDNFAADRECADRILRIAPRFHHVVHAHRGFMERTVRSLAGTGITQFLELGCGLPARPNVHEVAKGVAAGARVVYVDHDPVVVSHGHALMAVDGAATTFEADLRDPVALLRRQNLLDLDRPVAVMLVSVLDHLDDADDPAGIVDRLMREVAPGSHLVLSHFTGDFDPDAAASLADLTRESGVPVVPRGHAEVLGFFSGLTMLEPGLVRLPHWRPHLRPLDGEGHGDFGHIWAYGGVARKT